MTAQTSLVTATAAAIMFTLIPASAWADLGEQCAAARKTGDTEEANRIVRELLSGQHNLSETGINAGRVCIEAALGGEYEYDRRERRFQKVDVEAREQERQALAAAKARAEVEAREEAERLRQEIELRKATVAARLVEGCIKLYKRQPDETITNRLCYDVFIEVGLPQD